MNLRWSIRRAIKEQCFLNPSAPPTFGNYGCMDPGALNYDSAATHPCNSIGPNFGCSNCNSQPDYCGPGTAPGDCCQYPTAIPGCTDPNACNYDSTATTDDGSCEYTSCVGCTDSTANNYNPSATIDDGSCTFNVTHLFTDCTGIVPGSAIGMTWGGLVGYVPGQGANNSQLFYDFLGTPSIGQVVKVNLTDNLNTDIDFCIQYDGTDNNYTSTVTPFGSTMTVISTHGDCDDCQAVYGCTDPTAINYDPSATVDDNSCQYPIPGCTDVLAQNYDPNATVDDGSCEYNVEPEDCSNQLDIGCWICKDPINFPGCQQISNMSQVTMATGYGLQGFNNQQDCLSNTECGVGVADGPCKDIDGYVLSTYSNYQGGGPLDFIHFCEKCISSEISDPMCKCCKKDPCDKKNFMDMVTSEFNLEIPEFCKYCKYDLLQSSLCKCCKRFEKVKPKPKTKLGEEIKRIKGLL